jgi:hypothetical protein
MSTFSKDSNENKFSALDSDLSEVWRPRLEQAEKEVWRPRSEQAEKKVWRPRSESSRVDSRVEPVKHPEPSRYPTMSSGTMASLTKGQPSNNSYASNFSEQSRLRNNPNYVPPQKPVNISSEDDFPTFGVSKTVKPVPISTGKNLIKMAEEWGKKIEDEEEANRNRIRKAEEDRRIKAKEDYLKEKYGDVKPKIVIKNKLILSDRKNEYYDKKDGQVKPINVVEEDSFESGPSHDEEEEVEDDESQEDEFNTNIGSDRRHRDELY